MSGTIDWVKAMYRLDNEPLTILEKPLKLRELIEVLKIAHETLDPELKTYAMSILRVHFTPPPTLTVDP